MAEAKAGEPKPGTSINTMDRTEADKAAADKAAADKEAYEKSLKEAPSPPTPTQEEADLMKQTALGQAPEIDPQKKREAKAETGATYKTR